MTLMRSLIRVVKEEFLVIIFFLLFMATIQYSLLLIFGWSGTIFDPPSISNDPYAIAMAREIPDTDGDGLPDVIEVAPRGRVVVVDGIKIGTGTGTDPFKMDSDGDLFTDTAEDKQGTDPNNFFDLGLFWIMWTGFFFFAFYMKFIHKPDRLKEYRQNEALITSGSSGKYAYGVRAQKMSKEEKARLVESDPRFREITNIYDNPKRGRNIENRGIKYLAYGFLLVIILMISNVFLP